MLENTTEEEKQGKENICYDTMAGLSLESKLYHKKMESYSCTNGSMNFRGF